jgi:hypothetical protein
VVADDEALPLELGIGVVDRPGRREAAGLGHGVRIAALRPLRGSLVRYFGVAANRANGRVTRGVTRPTSSRTNNFILQQIFQ